MKKSFVLFFFLAIACTQGALANHLKGGFFTYRYLGAGTTDPSKNRYEITLTVYMDCNAAGLQINESINFTIYVAGTGTQVANLPVKISEEFNLNRKADEQCISGEQKGCYYKIVIYKLASVELAPNASGYTVTYQRCCRITGIDNILNSSTIGNTYSVTIPGTSAGAEAFKNNSARFLINDTIVICRNSYFEYPFLATDPDTDSLSYEFCSAWVGGTQNDPAPDVSSPPPYPVVPYTAGFSGGAPLGGSVTLDRKTGLISGIAPSILNTGEYVITVCVNEYKKGVLVASNRKELHVKVGDCAPIRADLNPVYRMCDDFQGSFYNNTPPNPFITAYYWEFGDGNSSTTPNPTHRYLDTGTYTIKLVVNRNGACSDSATSVVKVYPGFDPGFTIQGICAGKPTQFRDTTNPRYGVVDSWKWEFGDKSTNTDVSTAQNPVYTYPTPGDYDVTFIVTSTKGCLDTVPRRITIYDKPPLSVAFKDTLICRDDTLELRAIGNGDFLWTPNTNIQNANTANPRVYPFNTTTYTVQLTDNGCVNTEKVTVNVVTFVTLAAMPDTTICLTDTAQLYTFSNALRYEWTSSPDGFIDNSFSPRPRAVPHTASTRYTVAGYIGGCPPTRDEVMVTAVPYPVSLAGNDTTICFDTEAILRGRMVGTDFEWSPTFRMDNPSSLTPTVRPRETIDYVLTVRDRLSGCPKPKYDTITVNVRKQIFPFAGRDTSVVVGQPLQFNATGGVRYEWRPGTDLNATNRPNPVGFYRGHYDSIRYTVTVFDESNCSAETTVGVKIFKTPPSIFIPTAFTPNGDRRNDIIRPIAVGMEKIEYFRIFNRWGQLVFSTTINGHGWDGKIGGKEQGTNVYVWIVKAVDYLGKPYFAKGTVTLIR